ncbi:hypothetical protein EK21DRAFT_92461 [Setomelanomma holmii]|uniref:Uncharacterized protein n=1 Tax=Setomelanomma holmii TaxID=210430 RepID=A0A9P4LIM0_9PLEO|nr:hypothetical protein EK21DRAFT_92461 [Setomelanomma holmii]
MEQMHQSVAHPKSYTAAVSEADTLRHTFPFLQLPTELRHVVYAYAVAGAKFETRFCTEPYTITNKSLLGLKGTCKQIRAELPALIRQCKCRLQLCDVNAFLYAFFPRTMSAGMYPSKITLVVEEDDVRDGASWNVLPLMLAMKQANESGDCFWAEAPSMRVLYDFEDQGIWNVSNLCTLLELIEFEEKIVAAVLDLGQSKSTQVSAVFWHQSGGCNWRWVVYIIKRDGELDDCEKQLIDKSS